MSIRVFAALLILALGLAGPWAHAQSPFGNPAAPIGTSAPLDAAMRGQAMQSAPAPDLMRPVAPVIRNGAAQPGVTDTHLIPRPQASEQGKIAVRSQDTKTEFQEFIEKSTGRTLPIFGANLFIDGPTTFGEGDDGELYVASGEDGIFRIDPA